METFVGVSNSMGIPWILKTPILWDFLSNDTIFSKWSNEWQDNFKKLWSDNNTFAQLWNEGSLQDLFSLFQ